MRPIIGITTTYDYKFNRHTIGDDYVSGVVQAGGIPLAIPSNIAKSSLNDLVRKIDGLLLSGGDDVNPLLFNEEPHVNMGEVDPYRDELELEVTKIALESKKPILGICRGMQVINIVSGGGIIQDIPSQISGAIGHKQRGPRFFLSHKVSIQEGTLLHNLFRTIEESVNSFHHQAIDELGDDLIVNCLSKDGIIEGIESKDGKILAVQWHPENLWKNTENNIKLFKWLVNTSK